MDMFMPIANRVSYCSSETNAFINICWGRKKCAFLICILDVIWCWSKFYFAIRLCFSKCLVFSIALPGRCGFCPTLMQSLKSIFEKSYWQNFRKMQLSVMASRAINRRNRSNGYCLTKSMITNYYSCHWSFVPVSTCASDVSGKMLLWHSKSVPVWIFWINQKEVS